MAFTHTVTLMLGLLGVASSPSIGPRVDDLHDLPTWTIGVTCQLAAPRLRAYYSFTPDQAKQAAAAICDDILSYLRDGETPGLYAIWAYRADQHGTAGTLQFEIRDGVASGDCSRLALTFKTAASQHPLFDEPLYEQGDLRCNYYPPLSESRRAFADRFLTELQHREPTIREFLQDRVPIATTDGLGYFRLPPTAQRADFFCCQLEWDRYRSLQTSLFWLSTSLRDPFEAQGTGDPGQDRQCPAKHLVLAVCEKREKIEEILERSQRLSIRTEVLLRSYVPPGIRLFRPCD